MSLRSSGLRTRSRCRCDVTQLSPRHCERSEAIQIAARGEMDCFAALAMTADIPSPSRGAGRPRFSSSFALYETEGAGKTGCTLHPRSHVQNTLGKSAHEHTGSAETLRPSLRNGFTAYFVLSPENGSFASVATQEIKPAQLSASTATPEPHDFAVRFRRVRLARRLRPPHLTARS